jgi:hypothetical protein
MESLKKKYNMGFEVVNILTLFGKSTDVVEIINSLNVDENDITTLLEPNKVKFYSNQFCPYVELAKISSNYPNVTIKVQFADEDIGHNVGQFYLQNGEISEAIYPNGGSDEAYVMGMEITGDKFFVTDFLYGLDEDECEEEFPKTCINLAFKMRMCNSIYPTYILDMFEKWAVDVEDYEYASEISESIKNQI